VFKVSGCSCSVAITRVSVRKASGAHGYDIQKQR
jgi:hypothetical protein